jgi:SnoaL-like protein
MTSALFVPLLLIGCSSAPLGPYGYTDHYLERSSNNASQDAVLPDDEILSRFINFYNPLDQDHIANDMDQIYAEDLYFNDTLVTLLERNALQEHLLATAERLSHMSLRPVNVIRDDNQVYLVWVMEARFSLLGRERLSRTIGISQLRFNSNGKVFFHQDFWDSSQGLDQHLPVLGPMTRWLRNH